MNPVHAKITTHGFSHIGQRDENQDRLAILESADDGSRLLLVADGLGGHTGGLLAAETVVATTERCWRSRYAEQSSERFLKRLVYECHKAVCRAGREQALDPHSTIAALLLQDRQAISVHVGDSRVMQYSERNFIDRTLDHSVAQLHALRGLITDEEIAEHPDQNKLFAQVGGATAPEAEIKHWDLSEGRRFVVCSDGFWEIFRHDEIVELFMSDDREAELKGRFEHKLRQIEHHDNTTAILTEVIPEEGMSAHETPADLTSGDMASAGDASAGDASAGDASAGETSAETLAPGSLRRQGRAGAARAPAVSAALLMLLQGVGTAVGQVQPEAGGESGQGEEAPVSTAQSGVPDVADVGESAADGVDESAADGVDGNAEPGGLTDGRRESSPIRLRSSEIALDRPIEPGKDSAEAVTEELRQRGQLGAEDSLVNLSESRELGEMTILRMRQEHRGIPVLAAEVVVSTRGERIVRIAGDSTPDIRLDSIAPVNDYASTIALAERLTALAITPRDEGTLVVFPADGGGRLAWSGPVLVEPGLGQEPEELLVQNVAQSLEQVYFDAANGEVLLRVPLVRQALDRRIFDFSQACRDSGTGGPTNTRRALVRAQALILESPLVRSEAIGGWHRNAERLFDMLGAYYRFLRLILDIDSIDDDGKPLVGYIGARFDERIPGIPQCSGDEFMAFWLPADAMILTDAVLDFPELIGHEATHGLIYHGSGLIYQYQSGALHESIADVLGIAFRGWNEGGAWPDMAADVTMGAGNWQIRAPSSVIRDLQAPASGRLPDGTPLPDHHDDYIYLSAEMDDGGVHVNSSIMNHGFYLLAAGGRHTRLQHGPEVEGIGVMKAARIFGAAAAWLLRPSSGFEDARHAFAHVAEALHGEESMEWIAVHTSMDAIGIPGTWERPLESGSPEPIAKPEQPAPVPTSRTTPAPRDPPAPRNSPAPQNPPTLRTPPPPSVASPTDPATAPSPIQEQTPAQEPGSTQNRSQRGAAPSGQLLVLFLVAALALAGAAAVAYAYRPGRSSPRHWKLRDQRSRSSRDPASPTAIAGTLRPKDGTGAIPWTPVER